MSKFLLTGGGTAGHVIPHIALIEYIQCRNLRITIGYVGSVDGIEKRLIQPLGITYYSIITGKWRRYWSVCNLWVPIQLILGVMQSIKICLNFKPNAVLSKGGFVALPVVIAAWILRIPVIVHESDVVFGLANRLSFPLVKIIDTAFEVPIKRKYQKKVVITGLPMREALKKGEAQQGNKMLGWDHEKPILFIWGGSLGAMQLNRSIYRLLPQLTQKFRVVHLCGPDKLPHEIKEQADYRVFEYLEAQPLSHILACSDMVVSRAGATAIYELLWLKKPHILCPLSTQVSRGEQIQNARYLEKKGLSAVIEPENFSDEVLLKTIQSYFLALPSWRKRVASFNVQSGTQKIYEQLISF